MIDFLIIILPLVIIIFVILRLKKKNCLKLILLAEGGHGWTQEISMISMMPQILFIR